MVLLLIAGGCFAAGIGAQHDALAGSSAVGSVPSFAAAPSGGVDPLGSASSPSLDPRLPLVGGAPVGGGGSPSPSVGRRAAGARGVVGRSDPVELRIPAIGLAVSVSGLGLNSDQTVQVPTDFQRPGWFQPGPAPGQLGSAVILGHVDSFRGPAVFYRLRSVRPGDTVETSLADGAIARFVVNAVVMYPKTQFPAQQVYGSHGYSALQLVTCGGEFDTHTRSYLSNVVVYTTLLTTTAAHSPG